MTGPAKTMTLASVALPASAAHLLALRQLKSYVQSRGLADRVDLPLALFTCDQSAEEIAQAIIDSQADGAAWSVYPWNVDLIIEAVRLIKAARPETFIVLGGPYATHRAEEILARTPAEAVVRGPGEDVFYRLLENWAAGRPIDPTLSNLVFRSGQDLIDTGKDYYFDPTGQTYPLLLDRADQEIFYYETSRGCPFRCRYCAWNSALGKMMYFPRSKVEADLAAIFGLAPVRYLALCDSDLFIDKDRGRWLIELIFRLGEERRRAGLPEIKTAFEINPELLNDDLIDIMIRPPLPFNIISCGLQTSDAELSRTVLNRRIDPARYAERMAALFAKAKDRGLLDRIHQVINLEIIYGLPGDSLAGFKRTIEYILSTLRATHFICFRFEVLPGSWFWDHPTEYGLVSRTDSPHFLESSDTFPAQDIAAAQELVFFMYLFFTLLKGVMRYVQKQASGPHLPLYEAVIEMIKRDHAPALNDLYRRYHHEDENEILLHLLKDQADPSHARFKTEVVRQARELIRGMTRP